MTAELYRERRDALLKDAAESPLPNVRELLERSAAAFDALLQRELDGEARRGREKARRMDHGLISR